TQLPPDRLKSTACGSSTAILLRLHVTVLSGKRSILATKWRLSRTALEDDEAGAEKTPRKSIETGVHSLTARRRDSRKNLFWKNRIEGLEGKRFHYSASGRGREYHRFPSKPSIRFFQKRFFRESRRRAVSE